MAEKPTGSSGQENIDAGGSQLPPDAPCPFCNEPRGNQTPCPHCGME